MELQRDNVIHIQLFRPEHRDVSEIFSRLHHI